ncbi:transcription factor SPT20 homolog-like 1 [Ovis aries]|nr:transcription factor SPT20 homolog-like 1 [Ovis aries]
MQQAVEQGLDLAEYVIATAQQRPPKRKYSSSGETSLQEKLYDIYVEECEEEPEVTEELRSNVNLLEKLLRRESLPCLVINLYPGKQGYSLMLEGENGSFSESIRLPYEEREFLEYLDAEELPPVLLNFLEKSAVNVFHQGCVIAEIRDYRQSSAGEPPRYQSRHVLLRPTMQTLVCDVEAIASDHQNWTQEDKLLLESQLILATAEPLCLDPSVSVACTENRLLYNKQKLNTLAMKRSLRRFSAPTLNQQQELSHCPPPPEPRILTSCKKIRESKANELYDLKISKAGSCVDMSIQRPGNLAVPAQVDVQKYAKGKKCVRYEESQPTQEVLGDSAVGCEAAYQSQATRLTIRQPTDNSLATGNGSEKEATREREPCLPQASTDDQFKSFLPRPQTDAGRVVSRSEQLVQKSAQCPVQTSPSSSGSAHLRQPSPGTQSAQPRAASIQSSVPDWGARPPSPLKRRPRSPEKSSCGDSFTSQQAGSSQAHPSADPAPQPPSLSQRSSVQLNRGSSLPAATLSTPGALQRTPEVRVTTISPGVKVIRVAGPFCSSQASGRGCAPRAPTPVGIQPGQQPTPQRLNLQPAAPLELPGPASLPSTPRAVQVLLKNASGLRPYTVVQLPQGLVVWSNQHGVLQPRLFQVLPQQLSLQPCLVSHWQPAEQPSGTQGPGAQVPGAQASGPQAPGAQASGPQTPQVQTSGPQPPGAQPPRAQASGPQIPGAQTPQAQASGPQPPRAQRPRAKASGPQPPRAQRPRAQASRPQPPRAQPLRAQASGPQIPGAQPPRAQASVPQPPRAQPPRAQASVPQIPGAQPPRAQASGPQPPRAQTPRVQASGPQTPRAQASVPQPPRAQPPRAQASVPQIPGAQTPRVQASVPQPPRAQPLRAQASGPQPPRAQPLRAQASGPQIPGAQPPRAQASGPQTPRAQASVPQPPRAQPPRAQASGPQPPRAQPPRVQASGPQTPRAQASVPQPPRAQPPRAQASGPQPPRAQTPRVQASGPQTPRAQASVPQPPRAQPPRAQASVAQIPGAQPPRAQASGPQTPQVPTSGPQAPGPQTPQAQVSRPQCLGLQPLGAQGAARPNVTVHNQPTMVIHLRRQQDSLQPRIPGLSPPGSDQSNPARRILHHRIQTLAAPRRPIYWTVVQCPVAAAPTAPTVLPPQDPSPGSQTTGTPEGGPPATPKP